MIERLPANLRPEAGRRNASFRRQAPAGGGQFSGKWQRQTAKSVQLAFCADCPQSRSNRAIVPISRRCLLHLFLRRRILSAALCRPLILFFQSTNPQSHYTHLTKTKCIFPEYTTSPSSAPTIPAQSSSIPRFLVSR